VTFTYRERHSDVDAFSKEWLGLHRFGSIVFLSKGRPPQTMGRPLLPYREPKWKKGT
jgi:hypothetical protein